MITPVFCIAPPVQSNFTRALSVLATSSTLAFSAVCVAVLIGLLRSDVLSTFHNPKSVAVNASTYVFTAF